MEAVPRLPMLSFESKQSPEPTSFTSLKRFIADFYHEDPDSYAKEFHALESLRNSAVRASHDVDGCSTLKRYYCQLHSLVHRFMSRKSDQVSLSFTWKELYSGTAVTYSDINQEMAAILYNTGALHTQLGAEDNRSSEEGMKTVCTHFQNAAWVFGHLRDNYKNIDMGDLNLDLLLFMQQISFAQEHDCILEKSLTGTWKATTVATVAGHTINFYTAALAALTTSGDDGVVSEIVGSRTYKEWKRYVKFKIAYLSAILYLYQGQQYEEMQKMGERVTLYQAAFDKLEEARKESKGMANQDQINEAIIFTMDVIEAKRNAAKKENEYIYHEPVPELSAIPPVKVEKKIMKNTVGFNPSDSTYVNNDIFHRLVPMEAHEGSSVYSEKKAALLRHIVGRVEEKDVELIAFVDSLNLDSLQFDNTVKLPQGIVDRCAAIHARPNAITDLVASMSNLAESCIDVESMLVEIRDLLKEEDAREKNYQKTMGSRPGGHFSELIREYQKYQEAHNKAGESNETLRKAMGLHVSNLKTLAQPLTEITALVPVNKEAADEIHFTELRNLLTKVNEMKAQRAAFVQELRNNITADDITGKIVTWEKKLEKLFKKELEKHDKCVTVIEQNLSAQGNILKALTDAYAKCAPQMKALVETKLKRENFFKSLAFSYDVYEDLLGKSAKGLEFYRKLQGNVQKLVTRIRAARDVQEEERQQRLISSNRPTVATSATSADILSNPVESTTVTTAKTGPKLKDYLKSGAISISGTTVETSYIPTVRPNPLGSENTSVSTCVTTTPTDKFMSHTVVGGYQQMYYQDTRMGNNSSSQTMSQMNYSNDPGHQYYIQQQQIGQTSSQVQSGYTNPIYQSPQYYYTTAQGSNVSQPSQSSVSESYTETIIQAGTQIAPQQPDPAAAQQQYQQTTVQQQHQYLPSYSYYTNDKSDMDSSSSVNSYSANMQQASPITTHSSIGYPPDGLLSTCVDPHQAFYNPAAYGYPANYIPASVDQSNQQNYYQQPSSVNDISQQVGAMNLNQGQQWDYGVQKTEGDVRSQYGYGTRDYDAINSASEQIYQYPSVSYDQQYSTVAQTPQQIPQPDPSSQIISAPYPPDQYGQIGSYSSHPGYSYNQMTGEYQYASGYQIDHKSSAQYIQNHYTNAGEGGYGNTVPSNTSNHGYDASQCTNTVTQNTSSSQGQITSPQESTTPTPVTSTPASDPTATLSASSEKSSNLDLLSGIDFSTPDIPVAPLLQPKKISLEPQTLQPEPAAAQKKETVVKQEPNTNVLTSSLGAREEPKAEKIPAEITPIFERKLSGENFSILSQFESLDQSFNSDTSSVKNDDLGGLSDAILGKYKDALDEPTVLKWFHKEVERMEKFIEGVNIKTLNGSTPLDTKWKELQDLLVKDESKRTITVAKWFYEKNWKNLKEDYVPYDHARVMLPTETEDYINAAYVKVRISLKYQVMHD
ncbi:tyrosine-protein phosphatase non-receptor type 23 [Sergentomyia squamirostris]